jgi:hypothetical protein
LADCVSNPGDRALLVAMAARWHDLAERADKDAEPPAEPRPHLERRARFRVVSGSETPDLRSRRDAGSGARLIPAVTILQVSEPILAKPLVQKSPAPLRKRGK